MVKHRRKFLLFSAIWFMRYVSIPAFAGSARRAVLVVERRGWRICFISKPAKAKLSSSFLGKFKPSTYPRAFSFTSSSTFRRRRWVPDPFGSGGHWLDPSARPPARAAFIPSLFVRDERLKGWAAKHGASAIKYDRFFPLGGILVKVWMSGQWRTARLSGPYDDDYILCVAGFSRAGQYKTMKFKWTGGHRSY